MSCYIFVLHMCWATSTELNVNFPSPIKRITHRGVLCSVESKDWVTKQMQVHEYICRKEEVSRDLYSTSELHNYIFAKSPEIKRTTVCCSSLASQTY